MGWTTGTDMTETFFSYGSSKREDTSPLPQAVVEEAFEDLRPSAEEWDHLKALPQDTEYYLYERGIDHVDPAEIESGFAWIREKGLSAQFQEWVSSRRYESVSDTDQLGAIIDWFIQDRSCEVM